MVAKTYQYIYSSASIPMLASLVEEFSIAMNAHLSIDDLFYYGVFCDDTVYAYYDGWDEIFPMGDENRPPVISSYTAKNEEKLDYVEKTIDEVLRKEIEKPKWMLYIEMETNCGKFEQAPSTYLRLIPKEDKYSDLAEAVIRFLYSPNLIIKSIEGK